MCRIVDTPPEVVYLDICVYQNYLALPLPSNYIILYVFYISIYFCFIDSYFYNIISCNTIQIHPKAIINSIKFFFFRSDLAD